MKDILTSPRVEDMKRKARARRIRLSALLIILILSIVYALGYFSSNHRVTINKIVITGTRIINSTDIEENVNSYISGKYFKLFDKRNIFLYPKERIYKHLTSNFTRIDKLSIYLSNINTLNLDISERSGTGLYCGENIPETEYDIGENCYFINDDGYIFDRAPYFSGNIYFKYYGPISDVNNPLGQKFLPSEKFYSYVRLIDNVIKFKLKPTHLIIDEEGNSSLYLDHEINSTNPKIIFKTEDDLEKLSENFALAMSQESFASEINSKYTNLLYIDMRFKNKVLYKFQ